MSFELLTKDEVAARVHISRRFLERRIAAGTGPQTMNVGRRVLIRGDAFAAWVEDLAAQSRHHDAPALAVPLAQEAVPA